MADLMAWRRTEFAGLDDGIYLNAASIGPLPARSVAALEDCNRDRTRPERWPLRRINGILDDSRRLAARLINAEADEIALMPNTTTGLNVAARAIPLAAGDVVLTFDREFPSCVYPWLARAGEGIVLERLAPTPEGWPDEEALHRRLDHPAVKAVCVSLTQFSNGYTVDLPRLSRATRALGKWLIVDAIQALGQLPVDVQATPVDFLSCGAQKWLLGPWGTGFLYARRELCQSLPPTFAGWAAYRGTDDYTRLTAYDPEPWPDARRFEVLTFPVQDFAAMNASLELLLEVGVGVIADHLRQLERPLLDWAERTGTRVTSPQGAHGSGILCLSPDNLTEVWEQLRARKVHASLREGAVRLSPHVYNTPEEMERVVAVLG